MRPIEVLGVILIVLALMLVGTMDYHDAVATADIVRDRAHQAARQ
jgi:hypothetical protein